MSTPVLTDRQRETLSLIARHTEATGLPPTVRELAARLGGLSTNAVMELLERLERKGCLTRLPRKARGLVVTGEGLRALGGAS
ncbi:MAG: GntR family transcriptional regulator [Myxococcaceae bacterium]|nr:GntR family transcriptional regulator [Myxococcaceae bacterium]